MRYSLFAQITSSCRTELMDLLQRHKIVHDRCSKTCCNDIKLFMTGARTGSDPPATNYVRTARTGVTEPADSQ